MPSVTIDGPREFVLCDLAHTTRFQSLSMLDKSWATVHHVFID